MLPTRIGIKVNCSNSNTNTSSNNGKLEQADRRHILPLWMVGKLIDKLNFLKLPILITVYF